MAARRPLVTSIHGHRRVDDYAWLRDRQSEEVLDYLRAENAWTAREMASASSLQESLYEELRSRVADEDVSVPAAKGRYDYYVRMLAGRDYPVYCRRERQGDSEEQILLDVNVLAEGHQYFDLGAFTVTPDDRLLAYADDRSGDETFEIRVRDLEGGEDLSDQLSNASGAMEWAADSRTLFYVTLDEASRPWQVWRHRLGTDQSADEKVFEEADERFHVDLSRTRSEAFIVISVASSVTSEEWVLPADDPDGSFRCLATRRQNIEYEIDHRGDYFYIRTNERAPDFRLMRAPLDADRPELWEELVPHRMGVRLEEIDVFRDFVVLLERCGGLPVLRVLEDEGAACATIELPERISVVEPGANLEFVTETYRFRISSLAVPESVYDLHVPTRSLTLRKRQEIPAGFSEDDYRVERLTASAEDGTEIPLSLVYRKDLSLDVPPPCLLVGYGSYGIVYEPAFAQQRISLLDRGFVVAIAHIRGGGELGDQWHKAGKMHQKVNTFSDFIAAAEHLIAHGYAAADRLAISGRSAGGLLIGAVLNQRPELFAAAIAGVPFVDVINTMLDESLPLTIREYEEWGPPQDRATYEWMLQYSPYDNVKAQGYPHLLVTGGFNDPRVQYWEPAKWVAKLRANKTDDHMLLLKLDLGTGHAGASGRYGQLKEIAFEYAFLLKSLGVNE